MCDYIVIVLQHIIVYIFYLSAISFPNYTCRKYNGLYFLSNRYINIISVMVHSIAKYCNKYCKNSRYCNTYCKQFLVLQNMKVSQEVLQHFQSIAKSIGKFSSIVKSIATFQKYCKKYCKISRSGNFLSCARFYWILIANN